MICALATAVAAETAPIRFVSGGQGKVHVVADVSNELAASLANAPVSQELGEAVLRLQLRRADGTLGPNIFSSYRCQKTSLILTPRFGLVPGQSYLATLRTKGRTTATLLHRVPIVYQTAPPVVEAIYPTGNRLPANHLKFYVHFSQPMREGRYVFEHIQLLDAKGKQIHDPWRRRELWNTDATRLTLWIHPGRVKTGVNLRENEGPVLVPAQKYTLQVGAELKGADGQPLRLHRKSFSTHGPDRKRPLPGKWKMGAVRAGTTDLLRVGFGEPLDAALAQRCLRVYGPDGKLVSGTIKLEKHETDWTFAPQKRWLNEGYRLIANQELEDLAGNTPLRLFDTDLREADPQPAVLDLGFLPRFEK